VEYEVGRVYRSKTQRFYLAMDTNLLVSLYNGQELQNRKRMPGLVVMKDVTSDELCAIWNIEFEDLDAMTARHFTPRLPPPGVSSSPRGTGSQTRKGKKASYLPLLHRLVSPATED
jgi:hypothetical protein